MKPTEEDLAVARKQAEAAPAPDRKKLARIAELFGAALCTPKR
jgi:predicted secreted protein